MSSDVPGHLRHLWDIPLLSPAEEVARFRRLNYLKYRADQLWRELDPAAPREAAVVAIEGFFAAADAERNCIVNANTRLVVSIARRFLGSLPDLDELISTGNMTLLRAVERFDYARGFRFSTYATHSIQREFFRLCGKRRDQRMIEPATSQEMLLATLPERSVDTDLPKADAMAKRIANLIQKILPEREQKILSLRFGLSGEARSCTLREVGEAMGLSKERVRQLQVRAVQRLRGFTRIGCEDQELF